MKKDINKDGYSELPSVLHGLGALRQILESIGNTEASDHTVGHILCGAELNLWDLEKYVRKKIAEET